MGTFCFDQYEHPNLWCEEKKRFVEKQNAQESLVHWRQKKAEENSKKEQDKREIQDMAVKHCPWGRPGGGAPNLDIRRRDIRADGLHSTPGTKIIPNLRSSAFPLCRGSFDSNAGGISSRSNSRRCLPPPPPHKAISGSGHLEPYDSIANVGSQIRSAADRLYITLKDHPSMTFRNKGHVDIELRYKTAPRGKKTLEKIVVTEQNKCGTPAPALKSKKDNGSLEEPWGKAGPGGKPWRNPKAVGKSFMRSMGWTDKELLKQMDPENKCKVNEFPQRGAKDSSKSKKSPEGKNCCSLCVCKCPLKYSASSLPEKTVTQSKKILSNEKERKSSKTGCKNPLQKICPRLLKSCEFDKENNGVELVPLLAKRRGMHRPISLSSTDVTKRTLDNRWTKHDVDLLHTLSSQISDKRRRSHYHNQREMDLCSSHFDTFDQFWGRPGHGAPTTIKYKLNLDDLLYGSCVE